MVRGPAGFCLFSEFQLSSKVLDVFFQEKKNSVLFLRTWCALEGNPFSFKATLKTKTTEDPRERQLHEVLTRPRAPLTACNT